MKSILSIFTESANSFEGQEKGEKVILVTRRYPFLILIRIALLLILILVPLFIGIVFSPFLYTHEILTLFSFIFSVWCLLIWSVIFYSLTMYALDVWIITDRRIIDTAQHGLFNRTTAELHLSRIQDVSVRTAGVIQTLLHFGDLQVQTAGTEEKFIFEQIPNPENVKTEIMRVAHVAQPTI